MHNPQLLLWLHWSHYFIGDTQMWINHQNDLFGATTSSMSELCYTIVIYIRFFVEVTFPSTVSKILNNSIWIPSYSLSFLITHCEEHHSCLSNLDFSSFFLYYHSHFTSSSTFFCLYYSLNFSILTSTHEFQEMLAILRASFQINLWTLQRP